VGEREVSNLELCQKIAEICGQPLKYELVSFASSRPGHDFRYAMSGEKLKSAGFRYPYTFDQGIERTVRWFLEHPEWLVG
jgi:dTDP-D-glucose 4,6-dehydratase